jgi:hypothetical protein
MTEGVRDTCYRDVGLVKLRPTSSAFSCTTFAPLLHFHCNWTPGSCAVLSVGRDGWRWVSDGGGSRDVNVGTAASARDTKRSALISVHKRMQIGCISGSHAPYNWVSCDSRARNVVYTYGFHGGLDTHAATVHCFSLCDGVCGAMGDFVGRRLARKHAFFTIGVLPMYTRSKKKFMTRTVNGE